jgi:rhodanese-related sulfurtransferase
LDGLSNIGAVRLAELGLPFTDVILEEIFFIPPGDHLPEKPRPVTIYDLATISARPLDQVWQRLQEIRRLCSGVVLPSPAAVSDLLRQQPVLFDVRFAAEASEDPVPGALHLPSMSGAQWRAVVPAGRPCLTISGDGRKSFSAAMWLREQGIANAFCTCLADVRAALATSLMLIVTLASWIAFATDVVAADAESFQTRAENVTVTAAHTYTMQLFIQRPSLKILFNNEDAPEGRSDQEVFDGMNYEAESLSAVGLKASWRGVGLMATRRVGSTERLTTRKFEDYQLSHYTEAFGMNLRYQSYAGMIQLMRYKGPKQSDPAEPRTGDRTEYISRPESSVTHRSGALRYLIWGRNFSLAEAFGETAAQVRRGFGFPLFVAATKTDFDTGGRLVDDKYRFYFNSSSSLRRLTTRNGYIGGGAAGQIPWRKFFFAGHASFGAGGQKITVVTEENGTDLERTSWDGAYKADICFVLGWNIPRAFATITYDLEGTTFRHADIKATVQSDMIAAATGVRF